MSACVAIICNMGFVWFDPSKGGEEIHERPLEIAEQWLNFRKSKARKYGSAPF
jgi:hypothetical protein